MAAAVTIQAMPSHHPYWIAGAVVGPIFIILAAVMLHLLHGKLQRARKIPEGGVMETKAQLHGDDIKLIGPVLLETREQATELPVNELVGSELNAV